MLSLRETMVMKLYFFRDRVGYSLLEVVGSCNASILFFVVARRLSYALGPVFGRLLQRSVSENVD